MENGKESVYSSEKCIDGGHPMLDDVKVKTKGLTKREHFAAMAMQGLLANCNGGMTQGGSMTFSPSGISDLAVLHADALIEALSKP